MISISWYAWAGIALVLVAALLYWQFVLAEGAYFGSRVVCRLYDWTASRYEQIKGFDPYYEGRFVGEPLAVALKDRSSPRVLDVAAGTGRLPRALIPAMPAFDGVIVELDRARRMLLEGRSVMGDTGRRAAAVQADGLALPFAKDTFDAVVSLEALEFFPNLEAALGEMVRVLAPGGVLMITNRKGGARLYMPGRVRDVDEVIGALARLGMASPQRFVWQVNYDIVLGRKPPAETEATARGPETT